MTLTRLQFFQKSYFPKNYTVVLYHTHKIGKLGIELLGISEYKINFITFF